MSKVRPIIYEPHPVSPERKAELVAQGYRIVDAIYEQRDREVPRAATSREDLDAAIAKLPGEYTNADYVVNGMRSHFGSVFTDIDEKRIRDVVVARPAKASDGLTVAELKAALDAREIDYPVTAKKPELQALLDGAG